jgi:hypothetical protein
MEDEEATTIAAALLASSCATAEAGCCCCRNAASCCCHYCNTAAACCCTFIEKFDTIDLPYDKDESFGLKNGRTSKIYFSLLFWLAPRMRKSSIFRFGDTYGHT